MVALACTLLVLAGAEANAARDPRQSWFTKYNGGMLNAAVLGADGRSGIGVNCSGAKVVVMFQFQRAALIQAKVAYSIDDAVGKVVTGIAPDPLNPETVAVVTSHSSRLVRDLKQGNFMTFTTKDRRGKMMIGVVTLRGSSKALSRLSCVP